jgi:hypothetical protein
MVGAADPYATYRAAFFDRDFAEYLATVQKRHAADSDVAGDFVRAQFAKPGASDPVDKALQLLQHSTKKAAHMVKKVVESAIANAEHNNGADVDELPALAVRLPLTAARTGISGAPVPGSRRHRIPDSGRSGVPDPEWLP